MTRHADTVIRNGLIIDGTGSPPVHGDITVNDSRIDAVGDVGEVRALREIDASGLAVAPGFIDVHTHDDFAVLVHPDMAFKLEGGVTTCVVGNCGFGAAPLPEALAFANALHPGHTIASYAGYRGYLEQLDQHPAGTNVAVLAGHGTLRSAAMGNADRAPTGREMARMKSLLGEAIEAGVVGLSSGLIYEPGRYAGIDELVDLAGELRGAGGLYATHMRDEGEGLLGSVREAIEIGARAGVPVQISHHKAAGRENWGLVRDSLALIEAAQARGESVHADQYPYTAGSTILRGVLQNGAFLDGPAVRGGIGRVRGEDAIISSAPGHRDWEGRTVATLAKDMGMTARDAAERVEREASGATVILHLMSEDDLRKVMAHPSTMIGSDGIPTLDGKPHPRLGNTFARVIGRYGRDQGVLSKEEAVRRMTGFSAWKFGLSGRGEIQPGAFADLVIFDADTIIDRGTYERPLEPPAGIEHVFVNGVHALAGGKLLGARAGKALRRAD